MRLSTAIATLTVAIAPAGAALATDYYVAPLNTVQTCTADGSQACPWLSVAAAFSSKKLVGGDRLLLQDGDFGKLGQINAAFDKPLIIQSQNGSNAHIAGVTFGDTAKNISVRNLTVWHDDSDPDIGYLISSYAGSSYLSFENLEVRSRQDSINYLNWTLDHWASVSVTGFYLRGSYSVVQNNKLTGVRGGIYATGPNSLVQGNIIDGFAEDGMKGDGSGSTFRGNIVKNVANVFPTYHNDGFQSTSTTGAPIDGLLIENNTIIQWTNDPSSPLKGDLEGIGMFDGWYDNLTIRNNLIVTDHFHGISVFGTRGASIINNTVVDLSGAPNTSPWIKIAPLKDGTPSQNVLVANNAAMSIQVTPDSMNNVVAINNSVILDPAQVFANVAAFDYRPTATSGFIDTANSAYAPLTDIAGGARPTGAGPDRGAYEVGATSSTTSSGGTTTTTSGSTTDSSGTTTTSGSTTDSTTTTTTSGGGWKAKFLKAPGRNK